MLTEFVRLANVVRMPIAQTVMMVVVALPGVVGVLATQPEDVTERRQLLYSVVPPRALWNSPL